MLWPPSCPVSHQDNEEASSTPQPPQPQWQHPPRFRAGRLSSICPMTPSSISTRKWQKTASLGREGGAKNRRSCMISSNKVFCKNHRARSSAPGTLSAPAWPGRPCGLHSPDHSPTAALLTRKELSIYSLG